MTTAKMIKKSDLITYRASIKKHFKSRWGCDWGSNKAIKLGEDESIGSEIYDDYQRTGAMLEVLNALIERARVYKA